MEPKICLALGGGAARGLAHLGVLKVFEDAKIPIHMITGTSLGAMMGGIYASRLDAEYWMERSEKMIRSFHSRKTRLEFLRKLEQQEKRGFFKDMAALFRKGYFWGMTATKQAFIGEDEYYAFIHPLIPNINIEETKIPFSCVATDIRNCRRVTYKSGPLRTAISASCSLPGIFPPVKDNGMLLVDGGWVERVPVKCARELGADIVIAVDVSSDIEPFEDRNGMDIVLRADTVSRIYLNDLIIKDADVIIHPAVGGTHWADFSDARGLYKAGEVAALEKLVEIRSVIHRATLQRKKFRQHLRTIKNKIVEKMIGTRD